MNITLTGFMGAGKTCVGRRLARRLSWRFVDLDELIQAAAKMSIPRIFSEKGEQVFRRLERRCISRVIRDRQQVIATGGGAFVDPISRAQLRVTGPVICLTARPQVIFARVGKRLEARPMLADSPNPLTRIKNLLSQRQKAYGQADVTIDTSDLSIEQTVERVWEQLSPYLCRTWQYLQDHLAELSPRYGGKYVVVSENRIVAVGKTQFLAYQNASRRLSGTREAGIYYIPLPEETVAAL